MTQAQNNSPPNVPEHTLLRQIGRGAYGEVWLARNALGTYRAAKIIYRSQFDHERPYERELRAIREVEPFTRQHEGLVDILQVGERDDYFYYIMELADALHGDRELDPETYQPRTLTMELYERERLPVEGACAMGAIIARALAFLHEHNLVHRDVKLSNIIYVNGRVKLADVGLVTRSDASFSLVGTYGYIPREGPGRPPADIYALGKVLYEAATGKDRADFPEIDILDPALKDLNRIFLRACAEEPKDRYTSAEDMADELEKRISSDEAETTASTSSSSYKTGALAASLLLILALIFYSKDDKPASAGNNTPSSASPTNEVKQPSGPPSENPSGPSELAFIEEGLVAYYPFNGNAKDESGNGNNPKTGEITLAADRHGKTNKAVRFTSKGSPLVVEISNIPIGQAPRTISLWAKVDLANVVDYPLHQKHAALVEWGVPEFGRLTGIMHHLSGPTWFAHNWGPRHVADSAVRPNNRWQHLVGTYKDGQTKIYVDGIFRRVCQAPADTGLSEVVIGASLDKSSEGKYGWPYVGDLDDVRIYNRALTTEEVKALYALEKPTTSAEKAVTKGLVAYYPFNGNAKDESGNGNDGDIKGAKPCEDRFGRPSKAYRFNGLDDVISVPDSDMLDLGTNSAREWTVSIWFNGDIQREGWLLGKATQSGSPYTDYGILASRFPEHGFHGFLWGTGLSAAAGGSDLTDWMAVKSDTGPDKWCHLVAVYGGPDSEVPGKKVYIDGKLAAEAESGARKNKANGGPLGIGGVGSQGRNWKGEIDDVRIYNRALSREGVKALYALEKPTAMPTKRTTELFENSLGMQFVPVSGTGVLFSIWETRVKDYEAYAATNKGVNTKWKNPGYIQGDTHPAGYVNWNDAQAFCAWLTKKELVAGKLKPGQRYRLPTDAEWSVAIGLTNEQGDTPEEKRDMGIKGVYPWGKAWPPPKGFGNYKSTLRMDNFEATSPVGSFAANQHGIYDLGGNVWEWCEEWYNPAAKQYRVQRGASWGNDSLAVLLSSYRNRGTQRFYRDSYGFRCVLTDGSGR